ncbi:MAG: succinate dehydrogenase assembly factor 2 [Rhodobacteraceae bacterium]|nr:succinate dehydrogenase assembly factor 2 [Paracoccaceae bacterium]
MSEPHEVRMKRLAMRSMRRGIKEMDLILSAYADRNLPKMDAAALDLYEALLEEHDQDLYRWITGQTAVPDHLQVLISDIKQTLSQIKVTPV